MKGVKQRAKQRQWPVIRTIARKSKTVWEVDTGFVVRPRIRKKFDDKDMAAVFAEKLRVQRMNEGTSSFDLSMAQRSDASEALKVLQGLSATLKDAAVFFRTHAQAAASGKTVRDTWEALVDFKLRIQKKRPIYIQDLRTRLKPFVEDFGGRRVAEITSSEIQAWLYEDELISELTRKNRFALLSVLFGFAQGKRDRRRPTAPPDRLDNPMESVARPTFLVEPPEILNVVEASNLLSYALCEGSDYGLLPYLVLAMFCGVRAAELRELTWEDLNWRKSQLTIPARIAKKRRLRNIPIPDNALEWLISAKGKSGPIAPTNCASRLSDMVYKAGFKKWPQNGLRHSFGSYHFALFDNAAETAARLGHKGDDVLFDHYRALADKDDAQKYFDLRPVSKDS